LSNALPDQAKRPENRVKLLDSYLDGARTHEQTLLSQMRRIKLVLLVGEQGIWKQMKNSL
jgi:hypothetical protein